ncbi:hypothetical protein BZG01_03345 [Labilibaculum manganireducens]|uniref:Uncharacterized protein n=1 Tax=Labilibaculum manganireducens TaxID=1940525 RepID=A0A2N3IET1_9BACT|nr:hypothetical protein BZG01_03345 [Labilibaculum manganireducens]
MKKGRDCECSFSMSIVMPKDARHPELVEGSNYMSEQILHCVPSFRMTVLSIVILSLSKDLIQKEPYKKEQILHCVPPFRMTVLRIVIPIPRIGRGIS